MPYSHMVENWRAGRRESPLRVEDLPFLPVTVFKEFALKSGNGGPMMELNSSATTSGTSSRVFADKATRKPAVAVGEPDLDRLRRQPAPTVRRV